MTQPNILWISTHDINPDIGCYEGVWPGAEFAVTPNLDRLAAEGARYDAAFAAAPVCAPARSAIFTGCYPTSIGTLHMRTKAVLPPEVHLLPEYFRAAGYWTGNNVFTDFQVTIPPSVFDDCSPSAHWRNRPDPEQPFFMAFHGTATHESQIFLDDEEFAERTEHVTEDARHDPALAPLPPYYPDTEVFRTALARYADLITAMDHWVGEILAQLDEDGLAENTIVVFWSDHGKGMPRGKRWACESGLHEPLIVRWPGRIDAGTVVTDLVHTMDLAPTMLTAAGVPVPDHMQGVALFGPDGALADVPNEYTYGARDRMDEVEDMTRTVRDSRYRYIRNYHPDRSAMQYNEYPDHLAAWAELRNLFFRECQQVSDAKVPDLLTPLQRSLVLAYRPEEELYDIGADPHETRNLAGDPEHAATLERMRAALAAWQERFGDLGLEPESELIEDWRPGGRLRETGAVVVRLAEGEGFLAECDTPGSSIVWTTKPPTGSVREATDMERFVGIPIPDGRQWRLYTGPLDAGSLGAADTIWFQAWRIGYQPSPEVELQVPARV